ncbi:MAG: hypothetical protein WB919_10745 [Candidatus Sulfotelmatobacter sp.]
MKHIDSEQQRERFNTLTLKRKQNNRRIEQLSEPAFARLLRSPRIDAGFVAESQGSGSVEYSAADEFQRAFDGAMNK